MSDLSNRHSEPLPEGAKNLVGDKLDALADELGGDWDVVEWSSLRKTYRFDSFAAALAFVVDVGRVADEENHHPDVELGWGKATLSWTTHDVGGLTENDFVMAAKADEIAKRHPVKQ
jgi:4a-hydroxytetrahydrobiopterin dehydratase